MQELFDLQRAEEKKKERNQKEEEKERKREGRILERGNKDENE